MHTCQYHAYTDVNQLQPLLRTPLKPFNSLIALGVLLSGSTHLATRTGLNNIPTADTVGHRTVAIQAWHTFGSGPNNHAMGFKAGLDFLPLTFQLLT